MPDEFIIIPSVNQGREFIEIATDFSNPIELVREAVSNAYDAEANQIQIIFDVVEVDGRETLRIRLIDNGSGMTREGLKAFFDLGNSTRRNDHGKVGEKGHGTKVFFNSSLIRVTTVAQGKKLVATLDRPLSAFRAGNIPEVRVVEDVLPEAIQSSTEIEILGYNHDQKGVFTHERLKDYILWFTKHGSIEGVFRNPEATATLYLKGLDRDEPEEIPAGHPFPDENSDLEGLFEAYLVKAPDYYCKRIVASGTLPNNPEKHYSAVFSLEGTHVKYGYNPMLRRSGYTAPRGCYTVQERYGLWLCKDYIPIQKKNDWITTKGTEYTKFHAFFNCQALNLTANRGSVENTPADVMADIQSEVRRLYSTIVEGEDWRGIDWLEGQSVGYRTIEKERRDFDWRRQKVNQSSIAQFEGQLLVEPRHESGVHAMFVQLATIRPELFPFHILDYDTHEGIDLIVKSDSVTPIATARLFYVEFKYTLTNEFNHSFTNLHSIICWDTELRHDDPVTDIGGEARKVRISQPQAPGQRTKYYLENPQQANRIEILVLKDFLREELGLEFRPRTEQSVI